MKGGYRLKLKLLRNWSNPLRVLADVSVSRNWLKTVFKIIPKRIYVRNTSISRGQNCLQWQCSILVMWYRRRHVTIILHCHWLECWWHGPDVYHQLYLLKLKHYSIQIILGAHLSFSSSTRISSFSDWLSICWTWSV